MANDVRFRKPSTITRSGTLLYTYLEFYGAPVACLTEIQAFNAADQDLGWCFTDTDNLMAADYGANPGPTVRLIGLLWVFDNATVAAQAVSFKLWLYNGVGLLLDTY